MCQNGEQVSQHGPWPFVTRRIFRHADGSQRVWSSRHHRKRLVLPELAGAMPLAERISRCLWMLRRLNWWIGCVFAVGSLLFALASAFSLMPDWAALFSLESSGINWIYFAGSIPFTTAAYLQLFQAANADNTSEGPSQASRIRVFGWRPWDVGWLSCALQFAGTVLFNFNTFDAMLPHLDWFQQDLLVWVPNIVGSILFLLSGYLAYIETCHSWLDWRPRNISWWIVFINLLGCLGFLISALLSIVRPGAPAIEAMTLSVVFTLQGAICFLLGALLLLPETVEDTAGHEKRPTDD